MNDSLAFSLVALGSYKECQKPTFLLMDGKLCPLCFNLNKGMAPVSRARLDLLEG